MIELSIIIPCYNEEKNIPLLLKKIEIFDYDKFEIILINNGSIDNSYSLMKKLSEDRYKYNITKIINIKKNIGYGHGIMTGVLKAKGKFIGWTHADLQTDLNDLLIGYQIIKESNDKKIVVKGKRINRNKFDSIFTYGMSKTASFLMRCKLDDINAQPKIFPNFFLKKLNDYPLDFSLDLYLIYKARINGYKVLDFPVDFSIRQYGQAKGGGSLIGKFKLIKRTLLFIIKLRKKFLYGNNNS